MTSPRAEFRTVQFVPDPFLDTEFTVAALLRQDGRVMSIRNDHLPGPDCIGGAARAQLLELAVAELASHERFDVLPMGMGPHFCLSPEVHAIPSQVDNAARWVAKLMRGQQTRERTKPKFFTRGTEGKRFFDAWGVGQYVQKRFMPKRLGMQLDPMTDTLEPITHYVEGVGGLLLLEPVVMRNWKDPVKRISTRFAAYRHVLGELSKVDAMYVTYVLPSDSRDKATVIDGLKKSCDLVYDGRRVDDCRALADQVRHSAGVLLT